jgi:hypothetical protein
MTRTEAGDAGDAGEVGVICGATRRVEDPSRRADLLGVARRGNGDFDVGQ